VRKSGSESGLTLAGRWSVRRESGFLPRFGITKRISARGRGWTCVAGVPLLPFRVMKSARADRELRYRFLPLRDELIKLGYGWLGRGLFLGREFCRFRLLPKRESKPRR
jgi:hypothetical protein